jgi:hypothetical protein
MTKILLGYEVGTGTPVYVPLHHLAIFGITQLSGKTTTLEGLISRSGLKALAFIVKRGESGFTKYNSVIPFYRPRSDWQFVEGLVNVALGEKVKYEPGMRYGIMQVCKGRKDIKEIQKAAKTFASSAKRDFMKSVYEKLDAYLEIVIPELDKWAFTDTLELGDGVNVMDLSGMRLETQHLVIASTIEYAFANLDHVIVIIPEAWETIPQGKMTPVKWVAQQFIRKGATLGNYLWLDSQDIGGIDKTPLRQCDNWLMGRMKEAHEVERILKQLLGMKVPAEEIQTLSLGHFYAAIGNDVKKVYVLPVGVPEQVGVDVACERRSPESVRDEFLKVKVMESDEMYREKFEEEKRKREECEREFARQLEHLTKKAREEAYAEALKKVEEIKKEWNIDEYQETIAALKDRCNSLEQTVKKAQEDLAVLDEVKAVLAKLFPTVQAVSVPTTETIDLEHKELTVNIHNEGTREVKMSTATKEGQILYCAVTYFKDKEFTSGELNEKLLEHGWAVKSSTLSTKLSIFAGEGILVKTERGYRLPSKVKFTVIKA